MGSVGDDNSLRNWLIFGELAFQLLNSFEPKKIGDAHIKGVSGAKNK